MTEEVVIIDSGGANLASLQFALQRLGAQAVVSAGWRGGISAPSDIRATVPQIMEVLEDYFVPTSPQAKTRCIDGRHDENLNEDELGPQVPGGAPGSALAYRLGVDGDDLTRGTFTGDAEMMIEAFPGDHLAILLSEQFSREEFVPNAEIAAADTTGCAGRSANAVVELE